MQTDSRHLQIGRTVVLILLSLLAVTPRLFFMDVPFERDEGVYAYLSDVIDRGGIPYHDAFDHKPPLTYYLYNLSFKLFGHSVIAPRLTAILFTAIACLFVFLIVYDITQQKTAGLLSMLFLGLSSSSPAYLGFGTNTEIFTLPFLTAGTYCLLRHHKKSVCFLIAGLLFGFAFITKQVVVAIALLAFLTCYYHYREHPFLFFKPSFIFFYGFSLPFIGFSLYFAYHGSFLIFWDYFYNYNIDYATTVPLPYAFKLLINQIGFIGKTDTLIWAAAGVSFILFISTSTSFFYRLFIISLLVGSFIATVAGRHFFGHYFIVLLPFIAITIGLGAGATLGKIKSLVIHIGLLIVLVCSVGMYWPYFTMRQADLLEHLYGTSNPFYQSVAVGQFLKEKAPPDSTAFIIGSEAQILFYSGLKSASRIFYFYPLSQKSTIQQKIRSLALTDIKQNLPTYVIQVRSFDSHLISNYNDPFIIELLALLNDYRIIGVSLFNSDTVLTNSAEMQKALQMTPYGAMMVIYEKNKR